MDVVKRHRLGQPLKMVTLLTLLMGLILGGGSLPALTRVMETKSQ